MVVAGGGTHNNGDIRPLFGTWVLDKMTVDEEDADLGQEHTFIQFQGKVVMAKLIDDRHSLLFYSVGTWEREGDELLLDYTHYDDKSEPGTGQYSAPDWLLLTTNSVNRLKVLSLDSKYMRLQYTAQDGRTATYNFRKTF